VTLTLPYQSRSLTCSTAPKPLALEVDEPLIVALGFAPPLPGPMLATASERTPAHNRPILSPVGDRARCETLAHQPSGQTGPGVTDGSPRSSSRITTLELSAAIEIAGSVLSAQAWKSGGESHYVRHSPKSRLMQPVPVVSRASHAQWWRSASPPRVRHAESQRLVISEAPPRPHRPTLPPGAPMGS
jgi:hypothetical protein